MPPEIRIFDRLPLPVNPTSFTSLGSSISPSSRVLLHDGASKPVESVKKGELLLAANSPEDSGVSSEVISQQVMTPLIGFSKC